MPHTSPLKRITLHLARCKEFPDGSKLHGYEFRAPLRPDQHIDEEAWKTLRTACLVRRFWHGEREMLGVLKHKPGGANGATWAFDYDPKSEGDDEAGYRFGSHAFVPGEYVSIRDDGDVMHTFVVAKVDPI